LNQASFGFHGFDWRFMPVQALHFLTAWCV